MTDAKDAGSVRDFKSAVPFGDLPDGGMVVGRVDADDVLLARRGNALFAVGAHCTHYHGPLVDGLIVDDTVRCPWHHACFSLRTGEAVRAPALNAVSCWRVEQCDGKAFVREKLQTMRRRTSPTASSMPASVVIVGGGAAGNAAAEMLRRE